jgi:riboflavin synthase
MFNGIVFNTGKIKIIKKNKKNTLIGVQCKIRFKKKDLGTSISCNGVCLTLIKFKNDLIYFYISKETLKKSTFKYLKLNQIINLEHSLEFGQKISGHYIQGHVDTTAFVKEIKFVGKSWVIKLILSNLKFKKFLIEKASISINGISLTISKVTNNFFEINVIPHTLKLTNLDKLKRNDQVNVELDIFGKYIYKYSN